MKYFEEILETINKSVLSMDKEVFDRLVEETVEALNNGHKIVVSGLGKNVAVCEKFVGTMLSLGLEANFMHTNTAVHGDIGMVKDGDLTIVLTKSGETAESKYLVSLLKERKANIWLLSFSPNSSIEKEIGKALILKLENEGDLWDIVPNNSTTVNLIVLQGLAIETAKRKGITLEDFKRNHPGGHIGAILKNE